MLTTRTGEVPCDPTGEPRHLRNDPLAGNL